ncbi:uncharacterized protein LOC131234954 isoform X2 [Magnolia sinica]|nr:uncharacterized protein LOC131234954 isoform X2 [Magnolia sinica]XP_058087949.1 uncharacterized protein LOC131234954 isoform X2 [Magnolia sinica]
MLWSGEAPKARELDENMTLYFNLLQGLILLCHGSMVGAGPTLCASIRASAKQVVDCSLLLFKEAVSSKESCDADRRLSIPQLAGSVWEACSALKKTPTTNYTAIGRAITQVAVSVKDVLREMNELKPGMASSTSDPANGTPDEASSEAPGPHDANDDDGSTEDDDLGNDLSPEEMAIAQSVAAVVSDTLVAIKELIRFLTGLVKQSSHPNNSFDSVGPLERLLEICREIGDQVDELGVCVYPPQEVSTMKAAAGKIYGGVNRLQAEVQIIGGSMEGFFHACEGLETSLRKLESEMGCSDTDLVLEIQSLAVGI